MRVITVESAQPGMILARSVHDGKDNVLLKGGITLTADYIRRLKLKGVPYFYILDDATEDIEIDDVIPDEVRQEGITLMRKVFTSHVINYDEISRTVDKIIEELLTTRSVSLQVLNIKTYDNYTFSHSVNTCVLGIALAKKLKVPPAELAKMAIGLILHDIGKILVPESIVNKAGKLTDDEFKLMKKHSEFGWDILKKTDSIAPLSRIIALQHHEKYNGTGYPDGLKGDKIHLFAQIAAVADVYDAMTSDRIYRKKYYPHEALEYFMGNGNMHFKIDLVQAFLQIIPPFAVGTTVKLSTGDEAVVKEVDMNCPMRPEIRLLNTLEDVDLVDYPSITITEVL